MSKKGKAHAKPAADDRDAAATGAADDAETAGAGQAPAAAQGEARAGDAAQPAAAVDAGPQPGATDAETDAPDAGAAEGAAAVAAGDAPGNGDDIGAGARLETETDVADQDERGPEWPLDPAQDGERPADLFDRIFAGWDGNIARACCAAGGFSKMVDFDRDSARGIYGRAGAFVRANPDAPAGAISIELKLKGFRDLPETQSRDLSHWRVFAFALKEADRVDAEQAALATASPADAAPPVAAAGDMALMPQPGGFAPTGFTPRR